MTATEALRFTSVTVRRMPGVDPPGIELDDLSPGINVIHGPNTAGKTTVVRAMNGLMWPDTLDTTREILRAEFTVGDGDWFVKRESGARSFQKAGSPSGPPALPTGEGSERYNLALHDLLQEETTNRSFAERIVRELYGGYDVPSAMEQLGFDDSPSGVGNATRNARKAVDDVEEARDRLRGLKDKQRELRRLNSREGDARDARRRVDCLEQVLEWKRARDAHRQAVIEKDQFPEAMERVSGNEIERLESATESIEQAGDKLREAVENIQELRQTLEDIEYPYEDPARGALRTLREQHQSVKDCEQRIEQEEGELEEAKARREREAQNLVEDEEFDDWEALDDVEYATLEDHAREAEETRNRLDALEHLRDVLEVEENDKPSVDPLKRGCDVLENWLSHGSSDGSVDNAYRYALAVAVVGLTVFSVVTAVMLHPAFSGGILLALVIGWFGWPRGDSTEGNVRSSARREYRELGLPVEPEQWTEQNVRSTLRKLYDQRSEARLAETKRAEWNRHEAELEQCREQWEQIRERHQQLVEQYGVAPDTDQRTLYVLFNRLSRWQNAQNEVHGLTQKLEKRRERHGELLEEINEELQRWGLSEANSGPEVAGHLTTVETRIDEYEEANRSLDRARDRRDEARATLVGLGHEYEQLFLDLGLAPGDESALLNLCRQYDDYQDCVREETRCESVLEKERERMESMDPYESEYREYTEGEIESELEEARGTAGELESIRERMTEIKTQIDEAKRGYELEPALAERERAFDELEEQLVEDYEKVTGHVLGEYLQSMGGDRDLPAVFEYARDILTTVTNGRYELRVQQADPPEFRVVDTRSGEGQVLDELSSGTRVQVLIAVRLAFVEYSEADLKCPIYLDETLANADDTRARTIIESVLELARQGRQVFYFTAQGDEVAKWRSVTESMGEPINVVDLTECSGADTAGTVNVPDPNEVFEDRETVPDPEGLTHEEYGRRLDVPPIDPWRDAGQCHLWYLTEDTSVLESLLRNNVEHWGPLRMLIEQGSSQTIGSVDPRDLETVSLRARASETFLRDWRHGRNRPVDRAVLERADAVSDKFIDEVSELADQVDGDPELIITRLREGAVSGFRTKKKDELESYFTDNDYLDNRDPLDDDLIVTDMLSTIDEDSFDDSDNAIRQLFLRLKNNLVEPS